MTNPNRPKPIRIPDHLFNPNKIVDYDIDIDWSNQEDVK